MSKVNPRRRRKYTILHLVQDHKLSNFAINATDETPYEMHKRMFPDCNWKPLNKKE